MAHTRVTTHDAAVHLRLRGDHASRPDAARRLVWRLVSGVQVRREIAERLRALFAAAAAVVPEQATAQEPVQA